MPSFKDLTGQVFGRLTVIEQIANQRRRTAWKCRCECGEFKETTGDSLTSGKTRSCGCLWDDTMIKHGDYLSLVYGVWRNMLVRCRNPNNPKWPRYGGRGIRVCARWEVSYADFAADMGPRPEGATIERRDNNGPYSPENCYWATRTQQNRNTSQTRLVTLGTITKPAIEWCQLMGLNHAVLRSRLDAGWSVEAALTTPQNPELVKDHPRPHLNSLLTFKGKTMTIKEWGKENELAPEVIAMRISREWDLEEALTSPLKRRAMGKATP